MGGSFSSVVLAGVMAEGSPMGFSHVWRESVNCTRSICSAVAKDPSMKVEDCYVQTPHCVCRIAGGSGFKKIQCDHFYGTPSEF